MSVAQWNAGLDATWQPLYVECLSDFKNNNKTKTYGLQKEREREREWHKKKTAKIMHAKWRRNQENGHVTWQWVGKMARMTGHFCQCQLNGTPDPRATHTTMASSNGFSSDFPLSSRLWTLDSPKLKWCQGWWVCIATPPIYTHTHTHTHGKRNSENFSKSQSSDARQKLNKFNR